MNKRIKFLISITLIFALFVSGFILPAASFENDVETSTEHIILVNVDTNTQVYAKAPDTKWYAGFLSELMTFIVAEEMIDDVSAASYMVKKNYDASLPESDSSLKPFIGEELTAKDLMGIMMFSSGSDAAYALAYLASGGDIASFVGVMNDRAAEYGCSNTHFVSPGYSSDSEHYTSCRDLYRLYMRLSKSEIFQELTQLEAYIPESLYIEGDDDHNEAYTVNPEASIIYKKSPYYFRYTDFAKLSHTESTFAGMALTTTYKGHTYFFGGLDGLMESEKNIYADARKLTTWAYLNLSDRKLISSDEPLSTVKIQTGWGEYQTDVFPLNAVSRTFPEEFDEAKLDYTYQITDKLQTPVLSGQSAGRLDITYDGESVGGVWLVTGLEQGLGMLSDFGRFSTYVFHQITPFAPAEKSKKSAATDADAQADDANASTEG